MMTYASNGDGVLVQAGATAYTLDLAAPLSQVLHDGTSGYLYGNGAERLRAVGGDWYIPDALGSVRATMDASGTLLASTSYDPWGLPQASAIAPFGFTGEVQDAAGMVYLRARWYDAGSGRFGVRDPFAGFPEVPYSLNPYQYAYAAPTVYTDPSGQTPTTQYGPPANPAGGACANPLHEDYFSLRCRIERHNPPDAPSAPPAPPRSTPLLPPTMAMPDRGDDVCPVPGVGTSPDGLRATRPVDVGYIAGLSGNVETIMSGALVGTEHVVDLYHMEYGLFGYVGGGIYLGLGVNVTGYEGIVKGWSKEVFAERPGVHTYAGTTWTIAAEVQLPFATPGAVGGAYFRDRSADLEGWVVTVSAGPEVLVPVPADSAWIVTESQQLASISFHADNQLPTAADGARMAAWIMVMPGAGSLTGKTFAAMQAIANGRAWDQQSHAE